MAGVFGRFLAADADVNLAVKVYHRVNLALLGATPLALATDNTALSFPVDMALGLMFAMHGHIGMNYVITDYAPKISKGIVGPCRIAMLGLTAFTVLGLLKLNTTGEGLTETLKKLWRGLPKEEKKK